MNIRKFSAFIVSFFLLFAFSSVLVFASNHPKETSDPPTKETSNGIEFKIDNPFKHGNTVSGLLKAIINDIILPIGGIIAVLMFIYSGFLYVTAQGNETKIATAHRALLYTAIGTAVLLGAWVIFSVVENTIDQLKNG